MWCMSGAPHVLDGKHALELIRVVHHVWLTVNLMCTCDEFARVVHL